MREDVGTSECNGPNDCLRTPLMNFQKKFPGILGDKRWSSAAAADLFGLVGRVGQETARKALKRLAKGVVSRVSVPCSPRPRS